MLYFDFTDLITEYSKEYKVVIPPKGKYEYGEWVEGKPTEETLTGAILSLGENKIYRSEGTLTNEDRVLYSLFPLNFPLYGTKIIVDKKVYSILKETQNGEFTGVWQYDLKFVSAFNEEAEE